MNRDRPIYKEVQFSNINLSCPMRLLSWVRCRNGNVSDQAAKLAEAVGGALFQRKFFDTRLGLGETGHGNFDTRLGLGETGHGKGVKSVQYSIHFPLTARPTINAETTRTRPSGLHKCINSFLTSPLSTREKILLKSRMRGIEDG